MTRGASLEEACETIRRETRRVSSELRRQGLPGLEPRGKLLRPLTAYALVPEGERESLDDRFWLGALAIQMVHEASLLHDDILDGAPRRRGIETVAASDGIARALVLGDHLLTAAYRVAARAGSPAFTEAFIDAVEQTVAGEIAQQRSVGETLTFERYSEIVTAKSGELFGAAATLPGAMRGEEIRPSAMELGRRIGRAYQMLDDFLDYCPSADSGKPPLQDFRQRKWTWVLEGTDGFGLADSDDQGLLERLFAPGGHMESALARFEGELGAIASMARAECPSPGLLLETLELWRDTARTSLLDQQARIHGQAAPESAHVVAAPPPVPVRPTAREELVAAASSLGGDAARESYFGHHAKSFRFASWLFPRAVRAQVAGIYAYCRFTDDLVDEADPSLPVEALEARLDLWRQLSREAYDGEATGIRLLDDVMGETARARVPFHYMHDLVEGVRMDLRPSEYATMMDLRLYTYRVASVVGGWMTERFDVRDPWVLGRAYDLGHAMQLTNILRDVGEDLANGRLYLPVDRLAAHGLERTDLEELRASREPVPHAYRTFLEELMEVAEAHYDAAFEAIPALPRAFARPVAVASHVYRGIHREIRANGYDNLRRRAHTTLPRKLLLGLQGLVDLQAERGRRLRRTVLSRGAAPRLGEGNVR